MGGTGSSITVRRGAGDAPPGVPVRLNLVTPSYLETMGTPLLSGRTFDEGAGADVRRAIVNPTFAARLGLGPNPVGGRFYVEEADAELEIVGVVPDSKYFNLREEPLPIVFAPRHLFPDGRSRGDFVIRSALPLATLRSAVQEAVAPLGSAVWTDVRPYDDTIRAGLTRERLLAALSAFFGALAALVAAIGVYGVMAHFVERRRGEIGVRIALGASRKDIFAIVTRQAGGLLVGGLALGALLSWAAVPYVQALVAEQLRSLLGTLVVAGALLTVTAAAACYLPARRAAGLDPREALRSES